LAHWRIVDVLVWHRIGTQAIGKNDGWKQRTKLGRHSTQTSVFLPFARLIAMLSYKAQLVGITALLTEERHTSKCSVLDSGSTGHQEQSAGRRVTRGLFVSATG
jgi:IS605 OrfB family transposase